MYLSPFASVLFAQEEGFIGSFWFFAIGAVLLLGLVGLFLFMRSKQNSDD
jgi:LPXTG-motif cell wall-anchored protein